MHPWHHAESSAAQFGGSPQLYLPLHTWFDVTKQTFAHFTHRALRHHQEGIAMAVDHFGAELSEAQPAPVSVALLAAQHLDEDCHTQPTAEDWMKHLALPAWCPTNSWPNATSLATTEAQILCTPVDDLIPLHTWMFETADWIDGPRHLAFRHHSFGCFDAEEHFGTTIPLSDGRQVPTRVLVERHIRRVLGRILGW